MNIAIGADHAGYHLKAKLHHFLKEQGYDVKDFGTYSADSVDYPDFAHPVASGVDRGDFRLGVLICGSANGVCMTANKYQMVRAAICWNEELAVLARQHNDANILCLPARFISEETALEILKTFLSTPFEGGRHEKRVEKISLA